ncbi:WD40 repeat domain-containing protein [Shewanella dokdonensis]|uniref:WD40 repeat domain-containing protein n=1 Tax=Shewanella dokdonensis TaxID=712036 RepID=A0ABX8DH25_9GAMM|nr:WD40 repeat domain-containing protein [Shewanella dokdonensis]MCL1074276.1 WD40 repeat domain-containing protein [Shewanella dokdonensis]QVK23980.1 WD40 repeat domain-containing protein [Shewanella dokdonensis]
MDFYRLLQICSALLLGAILVSCSPSPLSSKTLLTEPSYSASLSQDGQYALLSNKDGIFFWDVNQPQPRYHWIQGSQNNDVIATDISPNNQYAITMSNDSVALWRTADGSALGWWSLPVTAQAVAVANNGQFLAGLADGSVMALNPQHQVLIKFLGHHEKVNSVAISADGSLALTADNAAKVLLWHTGNAQIQQQWQLPSRVLNVTMSPDGRLLFMSDSTGDAWIRDGLSGKTISKLKITTRQMNFSSARFIQNNTRLLTGTPARELQLWQTATGKKIASWQVSLPNKPLPQSAVVYSVSQWQGNSVQSLSSTSLLERWQIPEQR